VCRHAATAVQQARLGTVASAVCLEAMAAYSAPLQEHVRFDIAVLQFSGAASENTLLLDWSLILVGWINSGQNVIPEVNYEETAANKRCWTEWERFDRPDEWLTDCLDRARVIPNETPG